MFHFYNPWKRKGFPDVFRGCKNGILAWNELITCFYVKYFSEPLHKICENTGFHWLAFSHIRTESTILSLYGRIRVSENPYSRIFYAMTKSILERPRFQVFCMDNHHERVFCVCVLLLIFYFLSKAINVLSESRYKLR